MRERRRNGAVAEALEQLGPLLISRTAEPVADGTKKWEKFSTQNVLTEVLLG